MSATPLQTTPLNSTRKQVCPGAPLRKKTSKENVHPSLRMLSEKAKPTPIEKRFLARARVRQALQILEMERKERKSVQPLDELLKEPTDLPRNLRSLLSEAQVCAIRDCGRQSSVLSLRAFVEKIFGQGSQEAEAAILMSWTYNSPALANNFKD